MTRKCSSFNFGIILTLNRIKKFTTLTANTLASTTGFVSPMIGGVLLDIYGPENKTGLVFPKLPPKIKFHKFFGE